MAGIRNDIVKTNAIGLTSLLELHRETRFDIFHANWPYSGELLYLGKNYPNVTLDFCWANIIDPVYCQNLFKQILSAVPHGKIHAYGSDYGGLAERAWAHAEIARDNIAIALAEMVEMEYLLDEAKEVATAGCLATRTALPAGALGTAAPSITITYSPFTAGSVRQGLRGGPVHTFIQLGQVIRQPDEGRIRSAHPAVKPAADRDSRNRPGIWLRTVRFIKMPA